MPEDLLIAQQAKRIFVLEQLIEQYEQDRQTIRNELYCIGGPLNDNKYEFDNPQLKTFLRIAECVND